MSTGYVPPLFKKFGNNLCELLTKKYEYRTQATVKSKLDSNLTIETTIAAGEKGTLEGAVKAEYNHEDYGKFEGKLCTESGCVSGEYKNTKLMDGLTASAKFDTKPGGSVTCDYQRENFSASVGVTHVVDNDKNTTDNTADVSAAVGHEGLAVGGSVSYSLQKSKLSDYSVGAEYQKDSYKVALKTQKGFDRLVASYFHSMQNRKPGLKSEFGAKVETSTAHPSQGAVLTLGCEHELDKLTTVKGKVDSSGTGAVFLEHKLDNPSMKVSFSGQWGLLKRSATPDKFGVALTFGDF